MHVQQLKISDFMSHDASVINFPSSGIVVVTGENGAGKSSIIEATAVGLWGRSLRGTNPWRKEAAGQVLVTTDKLVVYRNRSASRTSMHWRLATEVDGVSFESTTKAQAALEDHVGTFDVWRRTHCFSASDASHFTMATDGERKRLLESILGIDRFDAALNLCRLDIRSAQVAASGAREEQAKYIERVARYEKQIADLNVAAPKASTADPADLERKMATLIKLEVGCRADIAAANALLAAMARVTGQIEERLRVARLRGKAPTVCSSCGQKLPAHKLHDYAAETSALIAELDALTVDQAEEAAGLHASCSELSDELASIRTRYQGVSTKLQEARVVAERLATYDQLRGLAQVGLTAAQDALQQAASKITAANSKLALLDAVATVLGLRGVRAHVLGRALSGIETCANSWLGRIAGPDLQLTLKSYVEKKSGGVSDALGLEIRGAGGGEGYRAASGGERRRIDIALLLALAEVSQQAFGQDPGTLFFDEVFDALDADGVEAVSVALGELAEDRVVVIVSHSSELVARLPATLRLHVSHGKVS